MTESCDVSNSIEEKESQSVAGKTSSEILAMKGWNRVYWYTKISPEEKARAMSIVEVERRQKISEALTGREFSEEHRKNLSEANRGNTRALGHSHRHTESGRQRIGESAQRKWQDLEYREMMCKKVSESMKQQWASGKRDAQKDKQFADEHKRKLSKSATERCSVPENTPNWKGGISFEPYCPKFNFAKKEEIRNRDNRICVLCGKSEIQAGRRLDVHHIDNSKTQGCDGEKWYLCSLCHHCHRSKDTAEKEFLIVTNPVV